MTPQGFPSVTHAQYCDRAARFIDAADWPASKLLILMETLGRGEDIHAVAHRCEVTIKEAVETFRDMRHAMTSRDYLPMQAQVALIEALRARCAVFKSVRVN